MTPDPNGDETSRARSDAARHLGDARRIHLPATEAGFRLNSLLAIMAVGATLATGAFQPASAGQPHSGQERHAQGPSGKAHSGKKVLRAGAAAMAPGSAGYVDLSQRLTPETASTIVQGIQASLHREMPGTVGRIEIADFFGRDPAKEARRIAAKLGFSDISGQAREILATRDWLERSSVQAAATVSDRTGAPQDDEGRIADPVCVIVLSVPTVRIEGRRINAPAGYFANIVLHEVGHCLRAITDGKAPGMSGEEETSLDELEAGASGEADVEAFAHVMMGRNGAGTEAMKARVASSDGVVFRNTSEAAVAYRFAPMLERIIEVYDNTPPLGFRPASLTGFAESMTEAKVFSEEFIYRYSTDREFEYNLHCTALSIRDVLADIHGGDSKAVEKDMEGWRLAQAEAHPFHKSAVEGYAAYKNWVAGKGIDLSYRRDLRERSLEETMALSIQATRKWLDNSASSVVASHGDYILLRTVMGYDFFPGTFENSARVRAYLGMIDDPEQLRTALERHALKKTEEYPAHKSDQANLASEQTPPVDLQTILVQASDWLTKRRGTLPDDSAGRAGPELR